MDISRRSRKRGVAGVISAVILFALVFSVGTGFFLAINNSQEAANSAYASRLSMQYQEALENLSLRAGMEPSGDLWLMANNTGGIPSTILSVYVSSTAGKILTSSSSTNSQFLVGPDLSPTLPLTLDIGASTAAHGNIVTQYNPGSQQVFINVLTSLGNVFSVPYPAIDTLTLENYFANQYVVAETVQSQANSNVNQVQVGGCYYCVGEIYAGGNFLDLVLEATSVTSPVPFGGTITVTATVSYANGVNLGTPSSVEVSMYSPVNTGSASATLSSSNPCSVTLSPNSQGGSGSCTFSYTAGATGSGTLTFYGLASACLPVATSTTTTTTTSGSSCSSGTTPIYSAVTSSNPVQVGTIIPVGSWEPNFFYYYYTADTSSCESLSDLCGLAVISHTATYVSVNVQVTNTYSSPLTILDGSYIQSVSPGVEFDFFIGESGSTSYSGTPTFTPYNCVDSPPSGPTGDDCISVEPGQTVTLMFVASSPGGAGWEWSTSYPGGSSGYPGGDNAQILLDYAVSSTVNSQTVWASANQDIPFEGIYVT